MLSLKKLCSIRHKIIFTGILCLMVIYTIAQNIPQNPPNPTQDKNKVHLEQADSLIFNKLINPDVQILLGNVRFRHVNTIMDCDSAYFYDKSNSLDAFGNVEMNQADTLFTYGNVLFYDGNRNLARLRENVRMENRGVTLFTDSLNYDRVANIGYYFNGGMIIDQDNELTSVYGQYNPSTKIAIFHYDVKLTNPKFVLYSDTLRYNTNTGIATILGPSTIVTDSSTIYCTRGWYNTRTYQSELLDRSTVVTKTQTLTGDTLKYNRRDGIGEVFGNIEMVDSVQKVILRGDYGFHDERSQYSFVTKKALAIEYSGKDSLFLHADTLKTLPDSIYKVLRAHYNVRFYRDDFQGVCDSMQYNTRDSVLCMYKDPIMWNETYQIYGDTILVYMNDSTPDFAHVKEFAFATSQKDSVKHFYDQLTGMDMKIYFRGKEVYKIAVSGNAESIYYPEEKDKTLIGLNRTLSGFLDIFLENKKIDRMIIYPTPQGSLTPAELVTSDKLYLKNFVWFDYLRPLDKHDIFREKKRKDDTPAYKSRRFRY